MTPWEGYINPQKHRSKLFYSENEIFTIKKPNESISKEINQKLENVL